MQAKFVAALTASGTFREMVGLDDHDSDEAVQHWIFGQRVTRSRDKHKWTAEDLKTLRHYGCIFADPDTPYGKHRDPQANFCFRPHGVTITRLSRLLVDSVLVKEADGQLHPTDEHDEEWEALVGGVLSEMLEWLIEHGGPKVQQVEVVDVHVAPSAKQTTKGTWQTVFLVWTWSED
jgi:hypothetical protein